MTNETAPTLSLPAILLNRHTLAITLIAAATLIPLISHQQLVTGTAVNALLILTSLIAGPSYAIMAGLIPSLAALSTGLLPLALAPAVPYIMVSNALYITVFSTLNRFSMIFAVLVAALAKFTFLYLSSHYLLSSLLQPAIVSKVIIMLSWPQLVTAVFGGLLVVTVTKYAKR
jgi:hypothetical protein